MSKRKEKIAQRQAEQHEFLYQRKKYNMARFMQATELGRQMLEEGRAKLTDGQIAMLEAELADNQKIIDEYLAEEGLNAKPEQEA